MDKRLSWLAEPQTRDLFFQFPLPLVIVDHGGKIQLSNRLFDDTFDAACLASETLRAILRDPHQHTQAPVPLQCGSLAATFFVRAVNIGDTIMLVFERSAEFSFSAELAEMHHRILDLEKTSATDRLTGAWNRTHFDKTITVELSRSERYRQPVALIFFDIDHFKQVNDRYGHAAGDDVLRELVKVVSLHMRTSDMLYRWGGEEFVVLAPATSYHDAAVLAETLRARIEEHAIAPVGHVTVSLGVVEHLAGESEADCFKRVDAALYAAKRGGRNRVVVDGQGNSDTWAAEQGPGVLHLNWHASYECGDPVIDQEHRRLFDLANTLIESAFTRAENPQKFDTALEAMISHVMQHFADEEAILARLGYADLDVQVRAHRILVEHALRLRYAAAAGGVTVGELVDYLADEVVARHMLKMDREFYPLFKSVPPSPSH